MFRHSNICPGRFGDLTSGTPNVIRYKYFTTCLKYIHLRKIKLNKIVVRH